MEYNEYQKEAIRHKDGPMLVLAGPGSGKTSVITERTVRLVREHHINPANILVITFTRAAAGEMKQRFLNCVEGGSCPVTFGTFHAVFFTVLKYAYRFRRENIITEEQRYAFMRELLSRYSLEYEDEKELIGALLGEIGAVKNSRIQMEHFYSALCAESVFRSIFSDYQSMLARRRLIDFDDMLTYTYDLFSQRPDILSAWQKRYPYILIDEFQDINQIQYDIVRMMAAPGSHLFAVGDDDQSIYRFRGSRPEIMLGFTRDYPDAKLLNLEVNYRSGSAIVDTASRLIMHNEHRFAKTVRTARHTQGKVSFHCFEDQKQENAYVADAIQKFLREGAAPEEIAVLCRTNVQPRPLLELLMEKNLPFCSRDKIPDIYEHWIAKDLSAYLRIAAGSRARADFLAIMNKPKRYIARDSLFDPQVDFEDWRKLYEEKPWIGERIEKLRQDVKMIGRMNPYAAINYIRRGIGYDDYLAAYAQERGVDKEELFELADEIQTGARGYRTAAEWFSHISDYQKKRKELMQKSGERPQGVNIMTLHGAKGLEFKRVFLMDVNEGIMPYKKAVLDAEIEEERRLFYVGMTRAKDELYLCAVKKRNNRDMEISRFVEEALP